MAAPDGLGSSQREDVYLLARKAQAQHVYKTIEMTGSSPEGIEAAIANAIANASPGWPTGR
jgi:hypothetical protein